MASEKGEEEVAEMVVDDKEVGEIAAEVDKGKGVAAAAGAEEENGGEGKGVTAAAENGGEEKATGGGGMIIVKCEDGEEFEMPMAAAMMSSCLRGLFEMTDTEPDGAIRIKLPVQVSSTIFAKVIEFCCKHAKVDAKGNSTAASAAVVSTNSGNGDPAAKGKGNSTAAVSTNSSDEPAAAAKEENLEEWDKEFLDGIEQWPLYYLLNAAHYLSIPGLLDIASQKVADMLKGKTAEEMREVLEIQNDFTEAELEEIRKIDSWAFLD
uniref:SKP1-like protein n=1 Tax=Leersia perrieri TaxID=77586 RepID=A0A0D9WWI8_9ORYZ